MRWIAATLALLLISSLARAQTAVVGCQAGPNGADYTARIYTACGSTSYPTSSWINITIDGKVAISADVRNACYSWTPTAGNHTAICQAWHWTAKGNVLDGTTIVGLNVPSSAVPSPSPTGIPSPPPNGPPVIPSPVASPSPSPTPISGACAGISPVYYVSSSTGNDSNFGTQNAPLKTVAKAAAHMGPAAMLFKGGDVFNAEWDLTSNNSDLCVSSYGAGQAIFDGQNQYRWAIGEVSSNTAPPTADNITIDNLEIRHYIKMGIPFANNDGGAAGTLQHITVTNNNIHDNGPGCSPMGNPCRIAINGNYPGSDIGGYQNQLELMDSDDQPIQKHTWIIKNNIVQYVGGHNALQVHSDGGPTQIIGNKVGPGCVHGCIDVKASGSPGAPVVVKDNIAGCGGLCGNSIQSAGFYTENTYLSGAGEGINYSGNTVIAGTPVGMQACAGGCVTGNDNCPEVLSYQNNIVSGATNWGLWLGQCDSPISSASVTMSGNDWGGTKTSNTFSSHAIYRNMRR